MEYIRDYAMYASIFGLFSFVWFGWAQEGPRASWRKYLGIASGAAMLICLLGVYLSVNNWDAASALSEKTAYATYLIWVYVEFALAGIGSFLLIRLKRSGDVAPWIAFIVGVHFIGLQSVFQDRSLYVLAALLVAAAVVGYFASPKLQVAKSAITGICAGTALFGFGVSGLIRFWLA